MRKSWPRRSKTCFGDLHPGFNPDKVSLFWPYRLVGTMAAQIFLWMSLLANFGYATPYLEPQNSTAR
jgi:hypothetical protein